MENKILKANIEHFDLIRVLSMISVIIIHTTAYFTFIIDEKPILSTFLGFIDLFQAYAVPTFFFLSGFLCQLSLDNGTYYLKRKIKKIYIPFILVSLFHIMLTFISTYFREGKAAYTISEVLIKLPTGQAFPTLWFIFSLTQMYIIFHFLNDKFKTFKILILAAIVNAIFNVLLSYFDLTLFGIPLFLGHISYFYFGIVIAFKKIKITTKLPLIITSYFILVILELFKFIYLDKLIPVINTRLLPIIIFNLLKILQCFIGILVINILSQRICKLRIIKKIQNNIKSLSMNSYNIYLFHGFFIISLERILNKLFAITYIDIIFYIILFPLTLIFSYITSKFMKKLPILNRIF